VSVCVREKRVKKKRERERERERELAPHAGSYLTRTMLDKTCLDQKGM
jgi:hypothetical protein